MPRVFLPVSSRAHGSLGRHRHGPPDVDVQLVRQRRLLEGPRRLFAAPRPSKFWAALWLRVFGPSEMQGPLDFLFGRF